MEAVRRGHQAEAADRELVTQGWEPLQEEQWQERRMCMRGRKIRKWRAPDYGGRFGCDSGICAVRGALRAPQAFRARWRLHVLFVLTISAASS